MLTQTLIIPGQLPDLNELLAAKRSRRGRSDGYAALKKEAQARVVLAIRAAELEPMKAARFAYKLVEPDRRRDPSNVLAGVLKVLEDALVAEGVLPNDGWRHVLGFDVSWEVNRTRPCVVVNLTEGP